MNQPNETEVYKKALGIMSQRVASMTLDLALAHAQLEDMHTQINTQVPETEAK